MATLSFLRFFLFLLLIGACPQECIWICAQTTSVNNLNNCLCECMLPVFKHSFINRRREEIVESYFFSLDSFVALPVEMSSIIARR